MTLLLAPLALSYPHLGLASCHPNKIKPRPKMGFLAVVLVLASSTTLVTATDPWLRDHPDFELLRAEVSELRDVIK